jgi:NAD(P)-dependent dehydrogenase (short-subunit alcohol dehydrogenase family)
VDLGLGGRRALVTGGSAGIGLEIARQLTDAGARVAIASRHPGASGLAVALTVTADLARPGEPERAVAETVDAFGGLDILVNNVGTARQTSFGEVTDADWMASFEINLMSHVRATRAALEYLRRSDQARIVNVASTAGKRPSGGMPDYSVMKAAMLSFSRLVADQEAVNGVLVNAVCPGPTRTPAWLGEGGLADQAAARSGTDRDATLARTAAGRPLGRMADATEIAAVCVFLCSARASYVTGAAWSADGGTVPIIL